jgi:hypothetical protein
MDRWDTETTAEREHVPAWLVELSQLWATQSATNNRYREEYQQIRRLARCKSQDSAQGCCKVGNKSKKGRKENLSQV